MQLTRSWKLQVYEGKKEDARPVIDCYITQPNSFTHVVPYSSRHVAISTCSRYFDNFLHNCRGWDYFLSLLQSSSVVFVKPLHFFVIHINLLNRILSHSNFLRSYKSTIFWSACEISFPLHSVRNDGQYFRRDAMRVRTSHRSSQTVHRIPLQPKFLCWILVRRHTARFPVYGVLPLEIRLHSERRP